MCACVFVHVRVWVQTLLRSGARGLATAGFPSHLTQAAATEVASLSNGVRVATEAGYGETATVGVFIDAGSCYESPATNGTAHFLEHMTFKVRAPHGFARARARPPRVRRTDVVVYAGCATAGLLQDDAAPAGGGV